jgi:enoyl-[acyl-carrier-protein] reductase (NADH)
MPGVLMKWGTAVISMHCVVSARAAPHTNSMSKAKQARSCRMSSSLWLKTAAG